MNQKERDELYERIERYDELNGELLTLTLSLQSIENGDGIRRIAFVQGGNINNDESYMPHGMFNKITQLMVTEYKKEIAKVRKQMEEI